MKACTTSPTGVAFGLLRSSGNRPRKIGNHSELFKVVTPCPCTNLGRESVSSDRHRHCASRTLKPEPLLSFILRVKADYC